MDGDGANPPTARWCNLSRKEITNMIKYEIEGGHLPVVICYPEAGQTLCTESGAMSWMSPNMKMDTNTAQALYPYFNISSGDSNKGGGINIRLGD